MQALARISFIRLVDPRWDSELHLAIVDQEDARTVRQERDEADLDVYTFSAAFPRLGSDVKDLGAVVKGLRVALHIAAFEDYTRAARRFPLLNFLIDVGWTLYISVVTKFTGCFATRLEPLL